MVAGLGCPLDFSVDHCENRGLRNCVSDLLQFNWFEEAELSTAKSVAHRLKVSGD